MWRRLTCILLVLILCLIVFGCKNQPTIENNQLQEDEYSNDEVDSKAQEFQIIEELDKYYYGYDEESFNDARIKYIEFGEGFAGAITGGYKYDFDTRKLYSSLYFYSEDIIESNIDDEKSDKFQDELKKLEMHAWNWTYYNEENYEAGECFDGGWFIEVHYDNGYIKTITGWDVVPEKGDDFCKAVKEFCGIDWYWA